MTLADLASLGSFVSGIAVLISLIYVGLQVRQSTRHTRAQITQGRLSQLSEGFLRNAEADAAMVQAMRLGEAADPAISDEQIYRYLNRTTAMLVTWEDLFLQRRDGLIHDNTYATAILSFRAALEAPGVRAVWSAARHTYDTAFRDFVDEMIASGPAKLPSGISRIRAEFAAQRKAMEQQTP